MKWHKTEKPLSSIPRCGTEFRGFYGGNFLTSAQLQETPCCSLAGNHVVARPTQPHPGRWQARSGCFRSHRLLTQIV